MLKLSSDYRAMDKEIERLAMLPGSEGKAKLDMAFAAVYSETQAQVHIITGALKASGKTSTKAEADSWSAEMTYGGPSSPKDVVYAWYELRRGDTHDYMRDHADFNDQIGDTVGEIVMG